MRLLCKLLLVVLVAEAATTREATVRAAVATTARRSAGSRSIGKCAKFVADAIDSALGVTLVRHESAKDLGGSLIKVGFSVVPSNNYEDGDVVIFSGIPNKHPHGHVQVRAGDKWISDFVQSGFYPSEAYRTVGKHTCYRWFETHRKEL